MIPFAALRRYARPTAPHREQRCELCGAPTEEAHPHVADLQARTIACSCRACALLFAHGGSSRHRTVPDRVLADPGLVLDDERWRTLGVPVRLAFFLRSSASGGWVACYPGPAGTTEAPLPEPWDLASEPLARAAAEDVEALLAWGPPGETRFSCLLVPISTCYELTAKLRRSWRGVTGGDEVQREIESFFGALRSRSRPLRKGDPR